MLQLSFSRLALLLVILIPALSQAQNKTDQKDLAASYQETVSSIDNILEGLYGVISGEKGESRDWELFRYLFHPEAKLIPSRVDTNGKSQALYWTVEDYINTAGDYLVEKGFFEKEIHRLSESFGPITHVFSTYESYHSQDENTPFARGINSIQLLFDGERWWIINIYWTAESPEHPLPPKYLP